MNMNITIKRGKLIVAALALLCLAAGVGCSHKSAHNKPLIVASLHNLSEPFFIAVRRELESEAGKLDVEISVATVFGASASNNLHTIVPSLVFKIAYVPGWRDITTPSWIF